MHIRILSLSDGQFRKKTGASRAQVFWWSLYDFANSLLIINVGLYFPQWLIVDNGVSDLWYNATIILGTLFLIFSAPILGMLSDRTGKIVLLLRVITFPIILGAITIGIAGQYIDSPEIRPIVGLIAFAFTMYFFQASLVFYNTLLGHISTASEYGRISGIGFAAGWIGSIAGLLLTLPFVEGNAPAGRIHAFVPAALVMFVAVVPSLLFLQEPRNDKRSARGPTGVYAPRGLLNTLKAVKQYPNIAYFLIAYWLYIDTIVTIQANIPVYLEVVMNLNDRGKAVLGATALILSALGGITAGRAGDSFGLQRVLLVSLSGVATLLLIVSVTTHRGILIASMLGLGLLQGAVWVISRAYFVRFAPPDRRAEFFGLYASCERFGALLGPGLWSVSLVSFSVLGTDRYRAALAIMTIPILLSLLVLRRMHTAERES